MSNIDIYLQYGISSDIAEDLLSKKLRISTIRKTSIKKLITNFNISENIARFIKIAVVRKKIDENTIYQLLNRNSYICCCCQGYKNKNYIIHHIIEYSKSQDNTYDNLAVLCPSCHDIAHSTHQYSLTMKLTSDQIRKSKYEWELAVEKNKVDKSSMNLDIYDADYINIKRIDELAYKLFNQTNNIQISKYLIDDKIINENGEYIYKNREITINHIESGDLINHYSNIFKHIISYFSPSIVNLDDIINKEIYNKTNYMCYYVGGLYGRSLEGNCTLLHFSRRKYVFNWILDNNYIISNTSAMRMKQRSIYIVYGIIRSVDYDEEKEQHIVDLRPYFIGMPTATINRTPKIRYIHNFIEKDDDR
ncbi:HNH endonuclease signature motif containing protein [Herpetosiphon gulosus]|uniref:HNH nuclease domain-containing protein n=1 Tax=Herpetosiphon gulosus TaxID=1973496 RepID=A0ABP9X3X5_9CHLR